MDTMVVKKASPDSHYAALVYKWYHSIDKKDVVGYPSNMIDNKTQDIVDMIKPYAHKHTVLVDIGSSDCQLAKDLSSMLGMTPVSVTIPNGHKVKRSQLDICKQIPAYKDMHVSGKVGVILFNHSLHHFKTEAAIQKALKEAYHLLEKGGVLLIRDHDSENDMFIDLQHVVMEMKYSTELPMEEYQKHMKRYVASLKTSYFNVAMMKEWCRQLGFTYMKVMKKNTNIKDVCNADIDISKTVYLCFRKQAKTRRA
jgi:predicted SAM-dependent methyltransferase